MRWIERTEDLVEVAGEIGAGPLAVDTEADSFHHYREKTCLIQLSYGGHDVLVDALSGVDLDMLAEVFADRGVRKILHGADYDVRMLRRDCGLTVHGLFDTMIAARLLGERAFGLAALLDAHLDVRLDKRHQRADWSVRPLPAEMLQYAVLDTCHLAGLADLLETRLAELGRGTWAEEEFLRLEELRWESDRRDGEAWARVKSIHALDGRQLAVVREVAELRESSARDKDVPPFRVLRDEVLVAVVRAATGGDPAPVRGLPRAWRSGAGARELKRAIDRGLRLDARECPELPRPRRRARRSRENEARLRRVCRRRDHVADGLGIEPSLLAPRALLERILDHVDAGRPVKDLPELRRWQWELLRPVIDDGDR